MNKWILWFVFVFSVNISYAEDSTVYKYYNYLKDSSTKDIDVKFGFYTETSENVKCIKKLIIENRFDLITDLLYSEYASSQYLAIIALYLAEKHNKNKMDSSIILRIDTLKLSEQMFGIFLKSGCYGWFTISRINDVMPTLKRKKGKIEVVSRFKKKKSLKLIQILRLWKTFWNFTIKASLIQQTIVHRIDVFTIKEMIFYEMSFLSESQLN